MIVEILGAKMLSPFIGLSHFVWTAQIAVTLVALACGYYVGGAAGGPVAAALPAVLGHPGRGALPGPDGAPLRAGGLLVPGFQLAVGSLLASAILFFIPLALLAIDRAIPGACDHFVRGRAWAATWGRLTSIGTLGSLAGTLLIGYLLIPAPAQLAHDVFHGAGPDAGLRRLLPHLPQAGTGRPWFLLLALGSAAGGKSYLGLTHKYSYVVELFRGNSHFGVLQSWIGRTAAAVST